MNEDEAQRMRDAIQRDQTSCRCGHLLAACADCRGWLVDHSPRISAGWRWYVDHLRHVPAGQSTTDEVEAYYIAYHESQR